MLGNWYTTVLGIAIIVIALYTGDNDDLMNRELPEQSNQVEFTDDDFDMDDEDDFEVGEDAGGDDEWETDDEGWDTEDEEDVDF